MEYQKEKCLKFKYGTIKTADKFKYPGEWIQLRGYSSQPKNKDLRKTRKTLWEDTEHLQQAHQLRES